MAITGTRYYTPNQFEFDPVGVPLASGRLFFYISGTTTPLDTFSDVDLTIPNLNPVTADANGRFGSIFLVPTSAYKVQLWNAATVDDPVGSQIWSEDPCGPAAGGISNNVGMIGEVRAFAGPALVVPSGWYLCYGQQLDRVTFSALFAIIGTTWGVGDGSTTFNLPDLRGRGFFGVDNMGGVAANRVTAGFSGIAGNTLGAVGGTELFGDHTHTVSDPHHTHALTDPGHAHEEQIMRSFSGGGVVSGGVANASNPVDAGMATLSATSGVSITGAATGITIDATGTGNSENMPPAAMVNMIIYAGA